MPEDKKKLKTPKKVKIPTLEPRPIGLAETTRKLLQEIRDRQSTDSNN